MDGRGFDGFRARRLFCRSLREIARGITKLGLSEVRGITHLRADCHESALFFWSGKFASGIKGMQPEARRSGASRPGGLAYVAIFLKGFAYDFLTPLLRFFYGSTA